MKHYINKDAVVAELNRLIAELVEEGEDTMFEQGRISAFEDVKVFINHTLEVKEVDLEKTTRHYLLHEHTSPLNKIFHQIVFRAESQYNEDIEKAFKSGFESGFEHGLKAQKGE